MSDKILRKFINEALLQEEALRGMPDFVIHDATDEAIEYLRRALQKSINQRSTSTKDRRIMMAGVSTELKKLHDDMHELITTYVKEIITDL